MSKQFKTIIKVLILSTLSVTLLAGCGSNKKGVPETPKTDTTDIDDGRTALEEEDEEEIRSDYFDDDFDDASKLDDIYTNDDDDIYTNDDDDGDGETDSGNANGDKNPIVMDYIIPAGFVKSADIVGDISVFERTIDGYESKILLSKSTGLMDLTYTVDELATFEEQKERNIGNLDTFFGLHGIDDVEVQDVIRDELDDMMSRIDLESPSDVQGTTIELPDLTFNIDVESTLTEDVVNKRRYYVEFVTMFED